MMSYAVVDVELDRQDRDDTVDAVEQFVVGRLIIERKMAALHSAGQAIVA